MMNNTGMRRVRRAGAAAFDAAVSNRDENNSVASDKYGKFNAAKAKKEMTRARAANRSNEDSEQLPLLSEKLRMAEQQTQHSNNRRGPMMDVDHSVRAMQKKASSQTAPSSGNSTGSLQRLQGVNNGTLQTKKMNAVFFAFGESPRILKRVKKVMKCNKDDDGIDKDVGHLDLTSHEMNYSKSMSKSRVIFIMLIMVVVVFSMGRRRGRNIEMEKESITLNKMKSHIQTLRGQPVLPSMEDNFYTVGEKPNIINSEKFDNDKQVVAPEVFFPFYFSSLSNLTEEYRPGEETPYFWDVHFSGESIAEAVFSQCYNLVMAAEFGLRQPDYSEDELAQFILDDSRYVNVELNTKEGILRAANLGLAQSHLADVIISPYLHNIASSVFTSQNPGRLFAIFRHPVDRAIGLYTYLSKASWDPMYSAEINNMTIQEFAKSSHIENNFMTRFIIGKPRGKLSHSDMLLAKKIVKYKVLVGLYDELETSMTRFQKYFGWTNAKRTKAGTAKCQSKIISRGDKNVLGHPTSIKDVEELETVEINNSSHASQEVIVGNSAWKAIERQNVYDLELYAFAKRVYALQGEHIFDVAA